MGFLKKIFGSKKQEPAIKANSEELKVKEIQITHKIEQIHKDIMSIDTKIEDLMLNAKSSKSEAEKIGYARRIKTLHHEKEMKLASQGKLEKDLMAYQHLKIEKETEKDLCIGKNDILKDIDGEALENERARKQLEAEERNSKVSAIIESTSTVMNVGSDDEGLEDILDAINDMKEEELTPSDSFEEPKENNKDKEIFE